MPRAEIHYDSDEEYRRLREIRDRYGVMWRGILVEGAKFLEEHGLIGVNAPPYLESNGGDQYASLAGFESGECDSAGRQVAVAEDEISRVRIEIALDEGDVVPDGGRHRSADSTPATDSVTDAILGDDPASKERSPASEPGDSMDTETPQVDSPGDRPPIGRCAPHDTSVPDPDADHLHGGPSNDQ